MDLMEWEAFAKTGRLRKELLSKAWTHIDSYIASEHCDVYIRLLNQFGLMSSLCDQHQHSSDNIEQWYLIPTMIPKQVPTTFETELFFEN